VDSGEKSLRARTEETMASGPLCGKYLGDNDGTCPQLTCIRTRGHDGLCDNVKGDDGRTCQHGSPPCQSCERAHLRGTLRTYGARW
jgi:hypothetical protein